MNLLRAMFTPQEPTRSCPHRWCRPLHIYDGLAAIVMVFMAFFSGWLAAILIPTVGVIAVIASRGMRGGQTVTEQIVEDIRSAPYLHVRRGWARVALTMDIIIALFMTDLIVEWATGAPSYNDLAVEGAKQGVFWISFGLGLLWGLGFMWFDFYAHKKATKPRKPIREKLPVWLGGVVGAQS